MLNHKGTQAIETKRLFLRKAQLEDAEAMFRNWSNDPEVTKYLTWPVHGNVEVTKTMTYTSWLVRIRKKKRKIS